MRWGFVHVFGKPRDELTDTGRHDQPQHSDIDSPFTHLGLSGHAKWLAGDSCFDEYGDDFRCLRETKSGSLLFVAG